MQNYAKSATFGGARNFFKMTTDLGQGESCDVTTTRIHPKPSSGTAKKRFRLPTNIAVIDKCNYANSKTNQAFLAAAIIKKKTSAKSCINSGIKFVSRLQGCAGATFRPAAHFDATGRPCWCARLC